jgi:hypothetical protein
MTGMTHPTTPVQASARGHMRPDPLGQTEAGDHFSEEFRFQRAARHFPAILASIAAIKRGRAGQQMLAPVN